VREGELVALAEFVAVDADRFERAARSLLSPTGTRPSLEDTLAAVLLYSGDLLPTDPYADWAALRRERLRYRFLAISDLCAELAVEAGLVDLAVDTLERAIRADPFDETRTQRAAAMLDDAGRTAAARAMRARAERVRRSLEF